MKNYNTDPIDGDDDGTKPKLPILVPPPPPEPTNES